MLVIDDNKLKLLRMKEKLLEFPIDNQSQILSEYKEMVIDIDKVMYERLIDMIKNTNYHNLPLEEQLRFLTDIENEYNNFNEFQCRYRSIYEKYANDELQLSLIENIYIDRIKSKISAINGYLVNNEKLLNYHNSLEELNIELIESEKKKEAISERLQLLENELVDNVLRAEGRLYNHGNLEYASVPQEFKKYGFDLEKLLNDSELLEQESSKIGSLLSSEEEKMVATKVCFNSMPNVETKSLYNAAYIDVLNTTYKVILLNFARLVGHKYTNYEEIKEKRIKLIKLISDRAKVLIDLGIKFSVDPFDRLKIKEQMEIIELLGVNFQNILSIKEKIKNTFSMVDSIKEKNDELYLIIFEDLELFNDNTSLGNVIDNIDVKVEHSSVSSNKVLTLGDIPRDFKLELALNKSGAVIDKVYKMFNDVPVSLENKSVVPELVVEKDDVFNDAIDSQDVFTTDQNIELDIDNELFKEVEPFEKVELFANKYDDIFSQPREVQNVQSEEMPELFFDDNNMTIESKENESELDTNNNLSFDEQIQELLDDDSSKVKKLVA